MQTLPYLYWDLEAFLLPFVKHYPTDKDTAAVYTLAFQSCPCWLVLCTLCLLLFELQACYEHLFVFKQLLWLISCFGSMEAGEVSRLIIITKEVLRLTSTCYDGFGIVFNSVVYEVRNNNVNET